MDHVIGKLDAVLGPVEHAGSHQNTHVAMHGFTSRRASRANTANDKRQRTLVSVDRASHRPMNPPDLQSDEAVFAAQPCRPQDAARRRRREGRRHMEHGQRYLLRYGAPGRHSGSLRHPLSRSTPRPDRRRDRAEMAAGRVYRATAGELSRSLDDLEEGTVAVRRATGLTGEVPARVPPHIALSPAARRKAVTRARFMADPGRCQDHERMPARRSATWWPRSRALDIASLQ